MRNSIGAILLLIIAFLGGVRSLGIGYLSDDWAIISHVSRHGNADAWAGSWLAMKSLRFHRPLFTGLYSLEYELFGVDPFPAHLHHVLWHVLAVGLVHAILRRLGAAQRAAFAGGIAFALHPMLPGATGWLAGRCGTVAGALTLLAFWAWLRRRDAKGAWAKGFHATAVVAAVLAVLTRESGYLALVLPLTVDLILDHPRRSFIQLARRHAAFAICGAALLLLRFAALGTMTGGYPAPEGLMKGIASLPEVLRELGSALLRLFGTIPTEFLDERLALPIATGASVFGIMLLGLVMALRTATPELRRPVALLVVLFFTQVVLLMLSGPTLAAPTGQRWYAAIAFFACVVGVAAGPLLRRERLFAPLLLLPAFVGGHLLVQDDLVRADRQAKNIINQTLASLDEEKARRASWVPPHPLELCFVSGLEMSYRGLPTLQWGFAEALRPPFQKIEPPCAIYPIHRFMFLGRELPWPYHPPIEAAIHVRGIHPAAFAPRDPYALDFDTLINANIHGVIEAFGVEPPKWTAFSPPPIEVLAPKNAVYEITKVQGRPLHLPVRFRVKGAASIELFLFLTTVDMRLPVPVQDDLVELDLGPLLEDYVLFRNEPTRIFVLATAAGSGPNAPPRLSTSIFFEWQP